MRACAWRVCVLYPGNPQSPTITPVAVRNKTSAFWAYWILIAVLLRVRRACELTPAVWDFITSLFQASTFITVDITMFGDVHFTPLYIQDYTYTTVCCCVTLYLLYLLFLLGSRSRVGSRRLLNG